MSTPFQNTVIKYFFMRYFSNYILFLLYQIKNETQMNVIIFIILKLKWYFYYLFLYTYYSNNMYHLYKRLDINN